MVVLYFFAILKPKLFVSGSNSNLSTLTIPNDSKSKVSDFSDDSSNLSTENENILAECIQSGMPKPKTDCKGKFRNF